MKRRALAVAGLALWAGTATAADRSEIPWLNDPGQALHVAVRESKPLLVDVWAIWCVPCKTLDEKTYKDPGVVEAAGAFVPLKLDADANPVFVERYRVKAYPTVLVLDHKGSEIKRIVGAVSADGLLPILRRAHEGYESYASCVGSDAPEDLEKMAAYLAAVGNHELAADRLRKALKGRKADPDSRPEDLEVFELAVAEADLAAGDAAPAAKTLQRLADSARDPAIRGRALVALVRAERERGRRASAEQAERRLRTEHPELAAEVAERDATGGR